jgi:hypothetical protein
MGVAWKVSPGAARSAALGGMGAETINLDLENLIGVGGPGCWVCEEPWSEAIADQPCPGDPPR